MRIGEYILKNEIGYGLTSTIYEAQKDNQNLVLKLFKSEISEELKSFLLFEFTLLREVVHPNLVSVVDFGIHSTTSQIFIVEEKIKGNSLCEFFKEKNKEDQSIILFEQCLHALNAIHRTGFLHGDLSPTHIRIVNTSTGPLVKIIDLGMSHPQLSKEGGTPEYIAPEKITGDVVDFRSDFYSLAICFYEALTKHNPFHQKSLSETLASQVSLEPKPCLELNPKIPSRLAYVITECLKKNPADRPPSLAFMQETLGLSAFSDDFTKNAFIHIKNSWIGREKEKNEALHWALQAKPGSVLLISGKAGVGKTILAEEIRLEMAKKGLRVIPYLKNISEKETDFVIFKSKKNNLQNELEKFLSFNKIIPPLLILIPPNQNNLSTIFKKYALTMTTIQLRPFNQEEIKHLIVLNSGNKNPPSSLVDFIFESSEGNPALANDLLYSIAQTEHLVDSHGNWNLAPLAEKKLTLEKHLTKSDLLHEKISQTKNKNEKIELLLRLAENKLRTEDTRDITFLFDEIEKQISTLLEKNESLYRQSQLIEKKIWFFLLKNKFNEGEKLLKTAQSLLQKSKNNDPLLLLKLSNFEGHIYLHQGELKKAKSLLEKNYQFWKTLPLHQKQRVINNDLALLLADEHDFENAILIHQEMLTFFKENLPEALLIARIHYALAECYQKQKKIKEAREHLLICSDISRSHKLWSLLLRCYNAMGNIEREEAHVTPCLENYEKGYRLSLYLKDTLSGAILSQNAGAVYAEQENSLKAKEYLMRSENLLKQLDTNLPYIKEISARNLIELTHLEETSLKKDPPNMMNEKLKAILHINRFLNSEHDPKILLRIILSYALDLSGAESGLILTEKNKNELGVEASLNIDVDDNLTQVSCQTARKVLETGRALKTDNATEDETFKNYQSVLLLGLKSISCLPIRAQSKILGVLYLTHRFQKNLFKPETEELLQAFADQAGLALENARLLSEIAEQNQKLKNTLSETEEKLELMEENQEHNQHHGNIVTSSDQMKSLLKLAGKVSVTDLSLLIRGESGTGKELLARFIHQKSTRSKGPFITINCSALPASLIEAELFGYKSGAFTGAVRDKKGLIEMADGGTLFLDEIGELDIALQAKLLRVIQEREILKLGDTKPMSINIRLLCATLKNLKEEIKKITFREDLYYRIAEMEMVLPPLRERKEDISVLLPYFVKKHAKAMGRGKIPQIDKRLVKLFLGYAWPGNIRELESKVRIALALCNGKILSLHDLPPEEKEKLTQTKSNLPSMTHEVESSQKMQNSSDVSWENLIRQKKTWHEIETLIMAKALIHSNWDTSLAAKNLNIGIATLYNRIRQEKLKERIEEFQKIPLPLINHLKNCKKEVFKAALTLSQHKPHRAARLLDVSPAMFYKWIKAKNSSF